MEEGMERGKKFSDMTGVILAGGRSTRFGSNKAFARLRGKPLIERVFSVMSSLFEEILLVTNTPEDYQGVPAKILQDERPYAGPLGGIYTALKHSPTERIFVVGCDMPILDPDVIRQVIEKGKNSDAAVPTHDGIEQYLMAVYSQNLMQRLGCCLSEEKLSLKEFCWKLSSIAWVPIEGDSWFNVNTDKDLKFLETHHAD